MKISFKALAYGCMTIAMVGMSSCDKNEVFTSNETKNGYEKIKGDSLPKIDFEKPNFDEDEAPEIIYLTPNGPTNSLRDCSFWSSSDPWVGDIAVLSSKKNDLELHFYKSTSQYSGSYFKLDVDLNEKAGGKFIYAYVSFTNKRKNALKSVGSVVSKKSKTPSCLASGEIALGCDKNGKWMDLNEGAGGKFIYLKGSKTSSESPVTMIMVGSFTKAQPSTTYRYDDITWERVTGDLNEDAGGKYIYLYVSRVRY